jgi:para-nitrobenzyl esterase
MRNIVVLATLLACGALAADQVTVAGGVLEGVAGRLPGVRVFKGVPFAAPPVGDLRWKPPQTAASWTGIRKADAFGNRCVQTNPYPDQIWRDHGESEDCLYVAIWTAAKSADEHRPVLVWFYGGGFASGSGDEPRYDGEHLAAKGVVVVNVNYRLGVLGFFAHPELTKESEHKASGDYGLLDQTAALEWVQKNIAAFGGDPGNVTIGGESAGSFSVSAQMASPLTKGLFEKAIGESGAFFPVSPSGGLGLIDLGKAEARGEQFAAELGAHSLADLRAMPATELRNRSAKDRPFEPIIDGYFLPADAYTLYAEGKQAHVPLLAGWNRDEAKFAPSRSKNKPTAVTFPAQLKQQFGAKADAALKVYPAATDAQAMDSAGDLASDNFIAYSTWKWLELQAKTSGEPVYGYIFNQVAPYRPPSDMKPSLRGAAHATEIEYVFDALDLNPKAAWTAADRKVADLMSSYWANFMKSGDPNGPGLPKWPVYSAKDEYAVMNLDANAQAKPEPHRDRYEFLDSVAADGRSK